MVSNKTIPGVAQMIISASRRTDIPNYFAEWFCNRVKEGFVLVRNPVNPHQISRICLSPDVVDGIVFWTKNPAPLIPMLDRLADYAYYFQFTLNPYGQEVEPFLPSKSEVILPTFQRLADHIGPHRVIWRYDPIFLSERYSPAYHLRCFDALAKRLSPYTKKCTISFLDDYRGIRRRMASLSVRPFPPASQISLARQLAEIAKSYGLEIDTCAEEIELQEFGIEHARCVDDRLFSALLGCPLRSVKDKGQRPACGCVESIDIGAYNSCRSGCLYCYATRGTRPSARCDPKAPLLCGVPGPEDKITPRKMESNRIRQMQFDS